MVIYLLIICLSGLLFFLLKSQVKSDFAKIPGPSPFPIVGNSHVFLQGKFEHIWLKIMQNLQKEYGNVVRFYVGTKPQIFLFGAKGFEKILSGSRHITKGFQYKFLWSWIGTGLLTSTGAKWHKHRKLLTPAFHFRILEDFLHTMNNHTQTLVDKLSDTVGQTVDIYNMMTHCALDIICETTMGVTVDAQANNNSEYVKAVYKASELVFNRLNSPWLYNNWFYSKTSSGIEWNKNLAIMKGFTKKVIQERREEIRLSENENYENDTGIKKRMAFLDLLISSSKDGTVLSDQDIQDEVDTFMFEGHDTTASSMGVTLYLIALDKNVQKKCQEELDTIFGDSDRLSTSADLANMKYLTACVKESLRLYGSVPAIGRVTAQEVELEGHIIPAGTELFLNIMVLHRDEKYFPDAEKYDPDRFYSDSGHEKHPYAYTPFSAGPRNCIGQKFAMMEVKVMLSSILRKFNVEAKIPMKDVWMTPELVVKPKNGFLVNFEHR